MIVFSKIENDVVYSKIIDNTVYSNEVDYASISQIIRILEDEQARQTEDNLTRLLE